MLENRKVLRSWRITIPKSFSEIVDFIKPDDFPIPCAVRIDAIVRVLEVVRETETDAGAQAKFDFETGVWPSQIVKYDNDQMRLSLPSVLGGTFLLPDIGKVVLLRALHKSIQIWAPENYVDWLQNSQEEEDT